MTTYIYIFRVYVLKHSILSSVCDECAGCAHTSTFTLCIDDKWASAIDICIFSYILDTPMMITRIRVEFDIASPIALSAGPQFRWQIRIALWPRRMSLNSHLGAEFFFCFLFWRWFSCKWMCVRLWVCCCRLVSIWKYVCAHRKPLSKLMDEMYASLCVNQNFGERWICGSIRFLLQNFLNVRVSVSVRMHCAIARIHFGGSVSVTSLTIMLGMQWTRSQICRNSDCDTPGRSKRWFANTADGQWPSQNQTNSDCI